MLEENTIEVNIAQNFIPQGDFMRSYEPSDKATPTSAENAVKWEWVKNMVDEAHLPHLHLPVYWDKTSQKQSYTVFDPRTGEKTELESGKTSCPKRPVDFIRKDTPAEDTKRTASAKLEILEAGRIREFTIEDTQGNKLTPCFIHGDYVNIAHIDHFESVKVIQERQRAFLDKMNKEPGFGEFVLSLDGMDKFFVLVGDEYMGTLLFYTVYFNAIDNLWLSCEACNCQKSASDPLEFLRKQPLYGEAFIEHLGEVERKGILTKTKAGEGLATVAIRYFWERHAHRTLTTKAVLTKVLHPLQRQAEEVDDCEAKAKKTGRDEDDVRAKRKLTDLYCKEMILKKFIGDERKIRCPKNEKKESPTKSPGQKHYVQLPNKSTGLDISNEDFEEDFKSCVDEAAEYLEQLIEKKLLERAERKKADARSAAIRGGLTLFTGATPCLETKATKEPDNKEDHPPMILGMKNITT